MLLSTYGVSQSKQNRANAIPNSRALATVTVKTPLPIATSGPGRIEIRYVNPLRFHYSLQVSSANITAPTPPAIIAPAASTGGNLHGSSRPTATNTPTPTTPDERWKQILETLKTVREEEFRLKQQSDTLLFSASMEQQCYKDRLAFYSSFLLDEAAAESLKQFAKNNRNDVSAPTTGSAADSCRRPDDGWPFQDLQNTEMDIYNLQASLFDLSTADGFADWKAKAPNGDNLTSLSTLLNNLLTQVQGLESTSDVAKNFQAAQAYNRVWRSQIEQIARKEDELDSAKEALDKAATASKQSPTDAELKKSANSAQQNLDALLQTDPLRFFVSVDCSSNWYGRGRTDTVSLHYVDLSASSPSDQSTQISVSSCFTPATVSTGIGMSLLRNRQYGFVSGRDPSNQANTISVIGATTDQQVTPLYALQYNIALKDVNNGWGLHAGVGAALGSSSGTANIEFLAGPAISLRRRAFFITPAFQLGRRDELLPGYKIGDPEGNGLTSIPIHTSWKSGFALSFTFSVAQ